MFYVMQFLIYGLPVAAIVFFVVSLVMFLRARRANRHVPETYSKQQMTARLVCLIVSSCIAGMMLLMVVGFALLLMMAVAFM